MSDLKRLKEITAVTFESVSRTELQDVDKETLRMMLDICNSVRYQHFKTKTNTCQPLKNTGNACVKTRSSRAALVCLFMLCFLLLTAVIVRSVYNYTNYTQEREELLKKNENLSNKINQLIKELIILGKNDKLIYYQFSFYYTSNENKSWTESRRDCQKRGADLIIINNKEEQDFVMSITRNEEFWIGLTDSAEEGRWKWVDGSELNSRFWASSARYTEPNGGTYENCVVTYLKREPGLLGWIDEPCHRKYQWICEKRI